MLEKEIILQHHKRDRPTQDDIRLLAYRIWQLRIAEDGPGDAHQDWVCAETILWAAYEECLHISW